MKHAKIMIFADIGGQGPDRLEEVLGSARALYEKYSTRQYAPENDVQVELIVLDRAPISMDFDGDVTGGEVSSINTEAGLVTRSGVGDRIGVYYVSHGASRDFPRVLHDVMRTKGWTQENLDYVNLTVCSTAAGAGGANWNIRPGGTYSQSVLIAPILQAFMEEGLRPQVASYAGFVTVAHEGMAEGFRPGKTPVPPEFTGKKVIQPRDKMRYMREGDTNLNIGTSGQRRFKYLWTYDDERGYYEPTKFNEALVDTRPLPLPLQLPPVIHIVPQNSQLHPLPVTGMGWVRDETRQHCARCPAEFGFFTRRHHCRVCGEVVCDGCSDARAWVDRPLTERGRARGVERVRVCTTCAPR